MSRLQTGPRRFACTQLRYINYGPYKHLSLSTRSSNLKLEAMASYFAERLAPVAASQKYLPNDCSTSFVVEDPVAELIVALTKIVKAFPPDGSWRQSIDGPAGLLQGPSGIAYVSRLVTTTTASFKEDL